MTSVDFYPFSAEIMQPNHIHYMTEFHSMCGMKKNDQRINVYLYVLYLNCNVVTGIVFAW